MAIDPEALVLMARDMVTDLPESVTVPRDMLFTLIKPAIALWQAQTASDMQKRQNFIVESDDIDISANLADIGDVADEMGFRLEFLREGDIEIPYGNTPNFAVKFVNSLDRLKLKGRTDRYFYKCYLSGSVMRFCAPGGAWTDAVGGTFKIRSVVIPDDVADMPAGVMPEIAIVMADLVRKQIRGENKGLSRPPR